MKKNKKLNISGTLLDNNQFYKYIEKIAIEHNIKKHSDKKTFPLENLKKDFEFITETYNLLNKHIKLGIKIHSAGEWILDNYYIIEENFNIIKKELKLFSYKNLTAISSSKYDGFARIYVLAGEIVAFTDGNINETNVNIALDAYQNKKELSFEEIEKLPLFLKIVLIDRIRDVCEKIYVSQIQKYRAQNIINSVIDKKETIEDYSFEKRLMNSSKYSFIEYMAFQLKKYGKTGNDYQSILEAEVSKLGLTVSDVIQKEHLYIANLKIEIGNYIKSIKNINRINIGEILENISLSEKLLNKDPANVYADMDENTKYYYRTEIKKLAKKAKVSEVYIVESILKLAKKYQGEKDELLKRKSHVGYYIIDNGRNELENYIFRKNKRQLSQEQKSRLYISSIWAFSLILDFLIGLKIFIKTLNNYYWIISFCILLIPISEVIIRLENYFLLKIKKTKFIPKMNYEKKIPEDLSTFVVIPCILNNKEKVIELVKKLEVLYIANKQENLYFAILGDCTQSSKQKEEIDNQIIQTALQEIKSLNKKYNANKLSKFYFLYRKRQWNDSESSFIGWERKRGLLLTFNLYIKGLIKNNFLTNTIEDEKQKLPNIKYIITLDSDTNLILNTACKLIGAMNHILNRPIIHDKKIVEGYGIMQPRISIDMDDSKKTKFIEIFSGSQRYRFLFKCNFRYISRLL